MIIDQVILDEEHNWQNIKNVCDLQTFYCLDSKYHIFIYK